MKKAHRFFITTLIAIIFAISLIGFSYWHTNFVQAVSTPLLLGGKIIWVDYCCNGINLTVGPPNPGRFLFTTGSTLYEYFNIYEAGPWVLGTASPGGFCLNPLLFCAPVPVDGTIIQVGTSEL